MISRYTMAATHLEDIPWLVSSWKRDNPESRTLLVVIQDSELENHYCE